MPKTSVPKLLLPVDGSSRSMDTVRYVGQVEAFKKMEVVLFNVFSKVPETYYDLAKEPKCYGTVAQVRAWEIQCRKEIETFMDKAGRVLTTAGFARGAVAAKIQNRRKGIARDILAEAQTGAYKAVVMRRRGFGAVRQFVMGSVAAKLVEHLTFAPLLIVGRAPLTDKYLVAMDSSTGAMRAVNFAAGMLGGTDCGIRLFHAERGGAVAGQPALQATEAPANIHQAFDLARGRFVAAGVDPKRIETQLLAGVSSRAAAIVNDARSSGCGTIILGRRGISAVRSFFIGRVGNKVINLGRTHTVWVVP